MEKRICKMCKNTYPLTEEFFYKAISRGRYYLRGSCKNCKIEKVNYDKSLKKLRAEQAKKDEWMEKFKNQIFTCKECGQEKTFDEMRKIATDQRIHSWCKRCYNKKAKDYAINYKVKSFTKVLEERRERIEKENETK